MGHAPENTLASFRKAVELGVDAIELDVHLTADDEVVVLHDPHLERTTSGRGQVRGLTPDQVRGLDAGAHFGPEFAGERVPTLREVLEWARERCVVDVEIKGAPAPYPGIAERVVELLVCYGMLEHAIVISFDHPTVRRVKALAPDLATGVLYSCRPVDPVRLARDAQADALLPHWSHCTAEDVERAHAAGLSVHPWATSEPDEIRALLAMGVDSITSNHPDRVLAEIEARQTGEA
ncbi:MAG: glycerophosphodiester phosphodiesterase [Chloroflexi bacterium]|nr:glycerophosphodiester phosphodiesterase [Chloroflexota bacterium]